MENFIITEEMMRNANKYLGIIEKNALGDVIAENSIDTIEEEKETIISLPKRAEENVIKKNIGLLHVLLNSYLKLDVEVNLENYDYYAGGIIMNQIERFKSNSELKEKTFDLLTDYKDFKQIVNTKIHYILEAKNDILDRFNASMGLLSNPENIKQMQEYLEQMKVENNKTEKVKKVEKK